ncbi:MAG: FlgD immunoglobulin-like domain containing protein [Candidatus Desantisbacteria bacterium]
MDGKSGTAPTFKGLSKSVHIEIFNTAGEMVRDIRVSGQSEWSWDGCNDDGQGVSSGVYIYITDDGQGQIERGKIGVVR